jgi:ABC-2 type transport system ATP-binding protein
MTETVAPSPTNRPNPEGQNLVIEIRNLTKRFAGRRDPALDDINFSLLRGQILGLIGQNGAGKTTLLKIIATLATPSKGDVMVSGTSVCKNPQAVRKLIGYMPDDFGLYEEMRVGEYLEYFAACYNIQGKRRTKLVNELLDLVDLTDRRKESLRGLSRGMKQRLGLARCLVNDPVALLLDEPANGLDPRARIELRELLKELSHMGKTIILSSNILTDLQDICDTLAVMARGKLIACGPAQEIANQGQTRKRRSVNLRVVNEHDLARAYDMARAFPWVVADSLQTDEGNCRLEMIIDGDEKTCAALLAHLTGTGVNVVHFGQAAARLEELFIGN